MVLDGNEASLFASTVGVGVDVQIANRSHLRFDDCSDIIIRALKIRGVNPQPGVFDPLYYAQHGIHLSGVDQATVKDCSVANVYGDGVYLESHEPASLSPTPCTDITVARNKVVGTGRHGMTIIHGGNISFLANTIDRTGYCAFDFEADAVNQPSSGIRVVGNSIGTHVAPFVAAAGNAPVNDVYIAGNTSSVQALMIMAGTNKFRQSGWVVTNNACPALFGSSTRYFDFAAMDGIEVSGNVVVEEVSGVLINNCSNVRVIGNTFTGAEQALEVMGPDNLYYLGPSWDYVEENNTL